MWEMLKKVLASASHIEKGHPLSAGRSMKGYGSTNRRPHRRYSQLPLKRGSPIRVLSGCRGDYLVLLQAGTSLKFLGQITDQISFQVFSGRIDPKIIHDGYQCSPTRVIFCWASRVASPPLNTLCSIER
jgi:hypothetical protein